MAGNYAPRAHGTDHDHPSRLRRPAGAPVQPFSRNAPRVAPVGEGPGQPGQFGEGGNWQLLEGPLAGKIEHQDAALQGLSLRASGGGAERCAPARRLPPAAQPALPLGRAGGEFARSTRG